MNRFYWFCLLLSLLPGVGFAESFDVIIRRGRVFDGSGRDSITTDVGIRQDRIVTVGDLRTATAVTDIDANGFAVTPGFINMLSWADESLIADGRGQSDVRQGVTLEVFGEGMSMGPLNESMRQKALAMQADIRYPIEWQTLSGYLDVLAKNGISPNVASLVGASTVREFVMGDAQRPATTAELVAMRQQVQQAMNEGALGVGAALIYQPGSSADTNELIELAQEAGLAGGGFMAHMRSEGDKLLEAVTELIRIADTAKVHAEAYHLKAAGERNWPKMAQAITLIEQARQRGLSVSANMYPYTAGATGFDAAMPAWVQEGGIDQWVTRLQTPAIRAQVLAEMRDPHAKWENLLLLAGGAERVQLLGFKNPALKPLTGKTLAEVARQRGKSPEDVVIDLVIEDHTRVGVLYHLMSEANVELGLRRPWISIGSDASAEAPEGVFLLSAPHPRAYGSFARFLGHYVREQNVTTLALAINRLTGLPAQHWKLRDRGCLRVGCFADVVVFDPGSIRDHASYDNPRQFATGVHHVLVNGVPVIRNGEHTGAKPGRVVRGPGWQSVSAEH